MMCNKVEVTPSSHRSANFRLSIWAYQLNCSRMSVIEASLRTSLDFRGDVLAAATPPLNLSCESPPPRPQSSGLSPLPAILVRDSPSGVLCPAGSALECTRWGCPNRPRLLGPQRKPLDFQEAKCSVRSSAYLHFMTDYEG